jgi:hypothetical protein
MNGLVMFFGSYPPVFMMLIQRAYILGRKVVSYACVDPIYTPTYLYSIFRLMIWFWSITCNLYCKLKTVT